MKGKYFCDVCSTDFKADSNDARAVCPGCNVDVLDTSDGYVDEIENFEPDALDPTEVPALDPHVR